MERKGSTVEIHMTEMETARPVVCTSVTMLLSWKVELLLPVPGECIECVQYAPQLMFCYSIAYTKPTAISASER